MSITELETLGDNPKSAVVNHRQECLAYSILTEPSNPLIPLMFGTYLDRLMRLYHYGKIDISVLKQNIELVGDGKIAKYTLIMQQILTARFLLEIKMCQQDILIVTKSLDDAVCNKGNIKSILSERLKTYKNLVALTDEQLVPVLKANDKNFPKDSPYNLMPLRT